MLLLRTTPFSAYQIAGENRSAKRNRPYRLCNDSIPAMKPGTRVSRPLATSAVGLWPGMFAAPRYGRRVALVKVRVVSCIQP